MIGLQPLSLVQTGAFCSDWCRFDWPTVIQLLAAVGTCAAVAWSMYQFRKDRQRADRIRHEDLMRLAEEAHDHRQAEMERDLESVITSVIKELERFQPLLVNGNVQDLQQIQKQMSMFRIWATRIGINLNEDETPEGRPANSFERAKYTIEIWLKELIGIRTNISISRKSRFHDAAQKLKQMRALAPNTNADGDAGK